MRFSFAFTSAVLAVLSFSAHAAIPVVEQLGDDELSCQELYDQVKTLDITIASGASANSASQAQAQAAAQAAAAANAQIQAQNAQAAAQVAQQAAIQAGSHSGFALGGLFGSIAAAVSNQQAAKAVQTSAATPVVASAEEVNAAGQRKTHLTRLFKQHKCKVKDLVK